MIKITYFALKRLQVGDGFRDPGSLVPEAMFWKHVQSHISNGDLAPVLVATLPEEAQVKLAKWAMEQDELRELLEAESMTDVVEDEVPQEEEEPDEEEEEDEPPVVDLTPTKSGRNRSERRGNR